nr:MAG TPA: hypothetical protein [Caudoviricetes sp.]
MNCSACNRPAKKCHGGSFHTPYLDRSCVPTKKPREGSTPECLPAIHRCGHKVKENQRND